MICCAAVGCKTKYNNRKELAVTFHRFPSNPELRKKWIAAVRRKDWQPTRHSRLCSRHFQKSDLIRYTLKVWLRENAVPSIFAHSPNGNIMEPEQDQSLIMEENSENEIRKIENLQPKIVNVCSLIELPSPNNICIKKEYDETMKIDDKSSFRAEAESNRLKLLFEIIKKEPDSSTQLPNGENSENQCSPLDNRNLENNLTVRGGRPVTSSQNGEESQSLGEHQSLNKNTNHEINPINIKNVNQQEIASLRKTLFFYERKIKKLTERNKLRMQKVKILQQKIRRRDKKIEELSNLLFSRNVDDIIV